MNLRTLLPYSCYMHYPFHTQWYGCIIIYLKWNHNRNDLSTGQYISSPNKLDRFILNFVLVGCQVNLNIRYYSPTDRMRREGNLEHVVKNEPHGLCPSQPTVALVNWRNLRWMLHVERTGGGGSEGWRPTGGLRCQNENDIKMDVTEIWLVEVHLISFAQDRG
jgi:hypothetical protein